jgi:hypothetical protein
VRSTIRSNLGFLVLVIEYVGGQERQEAYCHRMSKVSLN